MKKIVSLLLAAVLLLGLCACGAAAPAGEGGETTAAAGSGFRVGYSKADITPEGPVAMGGYGKADQRISKGVLSYLYVTCIAITDADDNTILIYGMDMCGCSDAVKLIRQQYKTLRGQVMNGEGKAALKGLKKILEAIA